MALFEGKTPAERNKMIAAIVLPVIALIFIVYMFSGPSRPQTASVAPTPKPTPKKGTTNQTGPDGLPEDTLAMLTPVDCCAEYGGGADAGRNIFAFYVKPTPTPPSELPTATPTPVPPPPIPLSSVAPQSVFARTGNFTLQLSGDKFGPADRVYIAGQEVPTQYKSMQQLTATVPASAIASPGQRTVAVRTPDGKLYSNELQLNVMQPPAPTYTYIGLLKRKQSNTAVLKDSKGELYSIREGDIIEGRFRVARISESGVEVVDKDLNVKHTLPFVSAPGSAAAGRTPGSIQPPPSSEEGGDEEP
jgi:hypothetical protein